MTMEEPKEKNEIKRDDLEEPQEQPGDDLKKIPPWTKQITVRGFIASFVVGVIYTVIVVKLQLTNGIVPNLNVSVSLLSFVFIRTWTKLLHKAGIVSTPFTPQENTVIQTCAVACYSVVLGGGFGSFLLALSKKTYELAGVDTEGNSPGSYKEPGVGWMTGFLFTICFVGLLALIPLRKVVADHSKQALDDVHRNDLFARESIPMWLACTGYVFFSIISTIAVPLMFPQLKWYYVVVAYILAPPLCFCNAYGAGLTDMNMSYNYSKVTLFVMAALVGKDSGVVAGLVACGLIKCVIHISSDLMQDFKCGHLTHTSPRSMVLGQAVGTAMGCVVAPFVFFLFYKSFDIGNPNGEFKAPFGIIFRNMAILGVQGFSALPLHCLQLCYGFFAIAVIANLVKDLAPPKIGKWVPLPMAMAVPFLVGAYFAVDMCIGSLIVFVWHKLNSKKASLMVPVVASGFICGDGIWILPSSVLALAKVKPPICMKFLSS